MVERDKKQAKEDVENALTLVWLPKYSDYRANEGKYMETIEFNTIWKHPIAFRYFLLHLIQERKHRVLLFWRDCLKVAAIIEGMQRETTESPVPPFSYADPTA